MLAKEMLNIMACPICKEYPLKLEIWKLKGNAIIEGVISCSFCGRKYPVNDSISCMLPDQLRKDAILEKEKRSLDQISYRWNKKQSLFLNWLKSEWDTMDSSTKLKIETEKRLQSFFNFYQPKGSILDVGCGRGEIRRYLIKNEYIGIDPANFILEGLIREVDFPFIQSLGEYIPFRDEVFDNILILATLDHVINPIMVLEESFRVLKRPGYIFILSSLEKGNLAKKVTRKILKGDTWGLIKGSFSYIFSKNTHLHHFTANDLTKLVSCYFEKVETKGYTDGVLSVKGQK